VVTQKNKTTHAQILQLFVLLVAGLRSNAVKVSRGGILFSNHFIANCPQIVPAEILFLNRSLYSEDMDKVWRQVLWLTIFNQSMKAVKSMLWLVVG